MILQILALMPLTLLKRGPAKFNSLAQLRLSYKVTYIVVIMN
jgi:hypothetical protein